MKKLHKKQVFIFNTIIGLIYLCGCNSINPSDGNKVKVEEAVYYQAYDHKWNDPTINPIFLTRAEAKKYADENNMGNDHSYEVRKVNYRYVVRVGFSDYTYSNGSWNDILYTADDFNDAYEYVVEYSSAHSDLIIYDLKTGKMFEGTP
jgi:hypothetical protein|tara:strand:- start:1668 stop:2111 length:444 start_codon:yes stop_codon:yes gene_type:complete